MREVDFPALAGLSDWLGTKNFAFFFLTFLPGNNLTVMTNNWFYPKTHLEHTGTEVSWLSFRVCVDFFPSVWN